MGAHTWTTDADVGIQHNNYITNKLVLESTGETKIAPFAKPFPGQEGKTFKNSGETINIMHVEEPTAPTSYQLNESVKVPIRKLALGNRAVTIVEWGSGMEYTDLNEQLSKFRPSSYLQKALIRDMTKALDDAAGAAFTSTDVKICFIPTSLTNGTFDTDGTPSTVATTNLTIAHCQVLADYIAGTIHAPPFTSDEYVGLGSRKTLRGLKNDPQTIDIFHYLQDGGLFFRGELFKTENIRWVQIDRETALSNTAGTSTVLGDAVVFGDEAIGYAEALAPKLFADNDHQKDFQRVKAVAWRGDYVYASVWNTATDGQAKIIRITSA